MNSETQTIPRAIIVDMAINKHEVKKILDIGAGSGCDLNNICRKNPMIHGIAIENYKPSIVKLSSYGHTVYECNLENDYWTIDDCSIDVVIANQVFEHLKEVFWVLDQCTKVLRVGGRLIIGVPNLASLHNRILLLFGRQPTSINNCSAHIRGFTWRDFNKLLNKPFPGGYRLDRLAGSNFYPFPGCVAKPLSKLLPTMSWAIFMQFTKTRDYHEEFIHYPTEEKLETNFRVTRAH